MDEAKSTVLRTALPRSFHILEARVVVFVDVPVEAADLEVVRGEIACKLTGRLYRV
jgi:hypothetical protein